MKVTLFSRPHDECFGCKKTHEVFEAAGVVHVTRWVGEDPEARLFATETLGYQSAPVVFLEGFTVVDRDGSAINHWSGLRPDLIKQVLEAFADGLGD